MMSAISKKEKKKLKRDLSPSSNQDGTINGGSESVSEDLLKQYEAYKKQFEEWTSKNKDKVSEDAYNKYVDQFRSWEKTVLSQIQTNKKSKKSSRKHEHGQNSSSSVGHESHSHRKTAENHQNLAHQAVQKVGPESSTNQNLTPGNVPLDFNAMLNMDPMAMMMTMATMMMMPMMMSGGGDQNQNQQQQHPQMGAPQGGPHHAPSHHPPKPSGGPPFANLMAPPMSMVSPMKQQPISGNYGHMAPPTVQYPPSSGLPKINDQPMGMGGPPPNSGVSLPDLSRPPPMSTAIGGPSGPPPGAAPPPLGNLPIGPPGRFPPPSGPPFGMPPPPHLNPPGGVPANGPHAMDPKQQQQQIQYEFDRNRRAERSRDQHPPTVIDYDHQARPPLDGGPPPNRDSQEYEDYWYRRWQARQQAETVVRSGSGPPMGPLVPPGGLPMGGPGGPPQPPVPPILPPNFGPRMALPPPPAPFLDQPPPFPPRLPGPPPLVDRDSGPTELFPRSRMGANDFSMRKHGKSYF